MYATENDIPLQKCETCYSELLDCDDLADEYSVLASM